MVHRNSHDRVAFAVHSYVVADGYKLTGVGDAAEDLTGRCLLAFLSPTTPDAIPSCRTSRRAYQAGACALAGSHHQEASTAGWNSGQEYAFRYAPAQASGAQHMSVCLCLPPGHAS